MANRICAWCEKYLGPAESELDSHGICPECMARVMPAAGFVLCTRCKRWVKLLYGFRYPICSDCYDEAMDDAKAMRLPEDKEENDNE
jgi:DNA-directed RNA polymerase subunit RPC12/RpoP